MSKVVEQIKRAKTLSLAFPSYQALHWQWKNGQWGGDGEEIPGRDFSPENPPTGLDAGQPYSVTVAWNDTHVITWTHSDVNLAPRKSAASTIEIDPVKRGLPGVAL